MRNLILRSGFPAAFSRLFATLVLFLALPALSLTPGAPLEDLDRDDQAALEALALYEPEVRGFALEAVTEADVLSDLIAQQQRSRDVFARLLEPYDETTQERFYELTRYPSLVNEVASGGKKSVAELEAIAAGYPDDVREDVVAVGRNHPKVVARVDVLLRDQETQFEKRISELPDAKRNAFRALLAKPELMALLADNATLSVLLGDAYERDPGNVTALLASLNHELSERASSEARDFAGGIEADPQLQGEVANATAEYEQETGYSAYQPTIINQTVVVRPYSWWVGYPRWYPARYAYYNPWYYWYPVAQWSVGGSYFGPRFSVSFGWPAPFFWGWYFSRPLNHYYYPRVTNYAVRHYDRSYRRYRPDRFQHGYSVGRFERKLQRTMPNGFLDDDGRRVDRFREYGDLRSDLDRERRRGTRGDRPAMDEARLRSEYRNRVTSNTSKYPSIDRLGNETGWETEPVSNRRGEREGRGDRNVDRRRPAVEDGRNRERTRRDDTRDPDRQRGAQRRAEPWPGIGRDYSSRGRTQESKRTQQSQRPRPERREAAGDVNRRDGRVRDTPSTDASRERVKQPEPQRRNRETKSQQYRSAHDRPAPTPEVRRQDRPARPKRQPSRNGG